jgi:hypothetical protein
VPVPRGIGILFGLTANTQQVAARLLAINGTNDRNARLVEKPFSIEYLGKPFIAVMTASLGLLLRLANKRGQVIAIFTRRCHIEDVRQLLWRNEAHPEGDFLGATDLESGPCFHDLDKLTRLEQAVWRAAVEPRVATTQCIDLEPPLLKMGAIEVGNFQFAAMRRRNCKDDPRARYLRLWLQCHGTIAQQAVQVRLARRWIRIAQARRQPRYERVDPTTLQLLGPVPDIFWKRIQLFLDINSIEVFKGVAV